MFGFVTNWAGAREEKQLEYGKSIAKTNVTLPAWVPQEAKRYLDHTEHGQTIRALARSVGCAPSTVMRQVRKIELRR